MASNINKIIWQFIGDTKSLEKGNKKAQSSFKTTQKQVGRLSSGFDTLKGGIVGLGLAFGGRELLGGLKSAVDAAGDFDESVNALKVTMGPAAEEILKIGESAAESFGISRTEMNEAGVTFAAFAEDINQEDMGGTFEDFIGRASDFASVMNIDVAKAMEVFQSGLAGESEPLRNFGLNLSAAAVQAHAVEQGITEAGRAMTDQEKVQARYSLLMAETAKTQGDFAATADGAANKSKILSAKMKDLQAEIGKKLMPVYEDLLGVVEASIPALGLAASAAADATSGLHDLAVGIQASTDTTRPWLSRAADMTAALMDWTTNVPLVNHVFNDSAEAMREWADDMAGVERGVGDLSLSLREFRLKNANVGLGGITQEAKDLAEALGNADTNAGNLAHTITTIPSIGDLEEATTSRPGGGGGTATAAAGGPISGTTLVGEAGPELFTPNRAGTITPNHQLGGGGGVTVVLNGFVGDPVALAQQLNDLLELGGRNGG